MSQVTYVAFVKFHTYKLILISIVSSIKLLQMSSVASFFLLFVNKENPCVFYFEIFFLQMK